MTRSHTFVLKIIKGERFPSELRHQEAGTVRVNNDSAGALVLQI
jgi:hypothetical protein